MLDPVFLLSKDEWKKLDNNIVKDFDLEDGYVLVYTYGKKFFDYGNSRKIKKIP